MDFVVLAKAVPNAEELRFDPVRRTVVREGAELLINPFDQRAVRVALELRRPGETVSVLSLGPPGARAALGDLKRLGVDQVLLLSDPAFAGSDTLATARALSAGLARVGHEVVLTGARSTDSETGEVGAEVAALLDRPVLSEARSIVRDPTGPGFAITVDTPVGWARYRLRVPFVVSVGEKIAKPLKLPPTAEGYDPAAAVPLLSRSELALDARLVGALGSPTVVGPVEEVAPLRSPQLFSEGNAEERVRAAAMAIAPLLAAPSPPAPRFRPRPSPLEEGREVLVLVSNAEGDLEGEALAVVAEIRRSLPGHWPSAVWVGPPPSEAATFRLERAGLLAGYYVPTADPRADSRVVARGVETVLTARPSAAAAVFLSDPFGREVAGQVAAHRSLGLVGDSVAVAEDPAVGLVWSKPSFGGRTLARIHSRTRPGLATVRPGTFAPPELLTDDEGFGWRTLPAVALRSAVEPVAEGRETDGLAAIARREVLVVVGMGVGGPDGVERVRQAIGPWGAGLVATRRVVDAGWLPRQLQVGLTGHQLAPRLAVLLGVSGSPHHMIGWRRAGAVLAVNSDPAAPVLRDVSVGIVGRVEEVLPPLVAALAPRLGR